MLVFTVPADAPSTLYYQCYYHLVMGTAIRIVAPPTTTKPATPKPTTYGPDVLAWDVIALAKDATHPVSGGNYAYALRPHGSAA